MKDRNGAELAIGDSVRFFPHYKDEEWHVGNVIQFDYNVTDNWKGGVMDVAFITFTLTNGTVHTWRRRSEDIEKLP